MTTTKQTRDEQPVCRDCGIALARPDETASGDNRCRECRREPAAERGEQAEKLAHCVRDDCPTPPSGHCLAVHRQIDERAACRSRAHHNPETGHEPMLVDRLVTTVTTGGEAEQADHFDRFIRAVNADARELGSRSQSIADAISSLVARTVNRLGYAVLPAGELGRLRFYESRMPIELADDLKREVDRQVALTLRTALAPFVTFIEAFDEIERVPGEDRFYVARAGRKEASLKLSDFRAAREAVKKMEGK